MSFPGPGAGTLARVAASSGPDADPLLPLWRALQVLRVATLVYAVAILVAKTPELPSLVGAWTVMAIQIAWSGLAVSLFSRPGPRQRIVGADVLITALLIASSWLVAPPAFWDGRDTLPTLLWSVNAVVSAAVQWGNRGGILVAIFIGIESNVVTGDSPHQVWLNATIPMLVCMALATGTVGRSVSRANTQLRAAVELRAATEERERLAREVHDGALQVLALVARRGGQIDPALAEQARIQERRLRDLLAQRTPEIAARDVPSAVKSVDIGAALEPLRDERTALSAPQHPVILDRIVAEPLLAATKEAWANAQRHAGPGAHIFVLVEDLPDEVVVSVRDDGIGIAPGRLRAAEDEGRLGVVQSIRGRLHDLGGQAELTTGPGDGTEWELHAPRHSAAATVTPGDRRP